MPHSVNGIGLTEEKTAVPEKTAKPAGNFVRIGQKPVMNYVIACLTFFNAGETEIIVQARGRAISRAVDTVELLRRAFVKNLEIKDIKIGTQELTGFGGRKSNVSTIDIIVCKTPQ